MKPSWQSLRLKTFASSSKCTVCTDFPHKALIPPQILVWEEKGALGHLFQASGCPAVLTEQQFGQSFQKNNRCEQVSAVCYVKSKSSTFRHSGSIFAHTAQLASSRYRDLLYMHRSMLQRGFLIWTYVYLTFKWNLFHITRLRLNYKEQDTISLKRLSIDKSYTGFSVLSHQEASCVGFVVLCFDHWNILSSLDKDHLPCWHLFRAVLQK